MPSFHCRIKIVDDVFKDNSLSADEYLKLAEQGLTNYSDGNTIHSIALSIYDKYIQEGGSEVNFEGWTGNMATGRLIGHVFDCADIQVEVAKKDVCISAGTGTSFFIALQKIRSLLMFTASPEELDESMGEIMSDGCISLDDIYELPFCGLIFED